MLQIRYVKHDLIFKKPAITSRGSLHSKPSWIFLLEDDNFGGKIFHGEVSIIPGLSSDDTVNLDKLLSAICSSVNTSQDLKHDFDLIEFPAVEFGYEMLVRDYQAKQEKILFASDFIEGVSGIPVNGLIWMGDKKFMFDQIKDKLEAGWRCIKLKIGGLEFEDEINLLKYIRTHFSKTELELRLDANGAFKPPEALEKLRVLSEFGIHSIEQPIGQGQLNEMAELCQNSPVSIALDEELIGFNSIEEKRSLLKTIKPHYIILKPSLTGGWKKSEEWISVAREMNIGFWITSALESNIGLNAIAQWTAIVGEDIIHGLGTGMLFVNNFDSPLSIEKSSLVYDKRKKWMIDI
jgi:o-succinylbenzoate synthase